MSIASALENAQQKVANCYTSVSTMGGTIPATQNLTNLPAAIESIPTGGGDTLYLENDSGSTISAGDKVLFNLGSLGTSTATTFTESISYQKYFYPICFFDDNSFLTMAGGNGYLHTQINGTWSDSTLSGYIGSGQIPAPIQYFVDNVGTNEVVSQRGGLFGYNAYCFLMTKSAVITLPQGYSYAGYYNGTHYVVDEWGKVDVYDIATNTIGTQAATISNTWLTFGRIINNKLFALDGNKKAYIYEISEQGVFTSLGETVITAYPLYVTSLSVGGYILATDDINAYSSNTSDTPSVAHLYCYKIKSDYTLEQVHVDALSLFESTSCLVHYDNRYGLLSVGTPSGVYFFEYKSSNFVPVDVTISSLPDNPNSFPYYAAISPDKGSVAVIGRYNYGKIYGVGSVYRRIVPNSAYNYNSSTSFTGIATGETDTSGKYEVNTVLPEVVNFYISTTLEADEVTILGGAE